MYIHRIRLENIRGFEELEFDLQRPDGSYAGWTVFTGENGSGKSTLLKAIALAYSSTPYLFDPNIQNWVTKNKEAGLIHISAIKNIVIGEEKFTRASEYHLPIPFDGHSHFSNDFLWAIYGREFACGYGPFRRIYGASAEAEKQMSTPETARFATLFNEAASLSEADRWIRDLKFKCLMKKEDDQNNSDEVYLLDAILRLLSDELLPSDIKIDKVDADGLWLKDKNNLTLTWRDMSDGYRTALALLIDIAKQMVAAYGMKNLATIEDGKPIVFNPEGVVLIDEIDAHLHPSWQREIGFWLKRHFPKIQFLVTSHSPIILQAADPNGLFVLPAPNSGEKPRALSEEERQKVVASRPDTILLTSAFGMQNTRSPLAVEKRGELAKLNSKKQAGAKLTAEEVTEQKELQKWNPEEE